MSGFAVTRHRVSALSLALMLGLSAYALGGCVVQTASGDPASTSIAQAAAQGQEAESAEAPSAASGATEQVTTKPETGAASGEKPTKSISTEYMRRSVADPTSPVPWLPR